MGTAGFGMVEIGEAANNNWSANFDDLVVDEPDVALETGHSVRDGRDGLWLQLTTMRETAEATATERHRKRSRHTLEER